MTLLRRRVPPAGPLRVLYVVPDLATGGAERHVSEVFSRLDRARFAPTVICIGDQGALFADLTAQGVGARALGRSRREAPRALVDLVRQMRRERPDIVITRGYNAEILGRIAATLARVPRQVVWVHNCGDLVPRGRVRGLLDRLLDPVTSAYYGVAHAQLPYLLDDLGHPGDKIEIIHNGVDAAAHPYRDDAPRDAALCAGLGIGPDDPVLGILAVLRPEKDHETFLRAAAIVHESLPAARFLVIGDGPLRGELEHLAADLGIADRVVFTGRRTDVHALLRLMDVFSLSSYTIECCPYALLEAMANGRPAVCTAVGGIPEMVEDGVTGAVVPPRDPDALAAAVLPLLTDRHLARAMGRAARRRAENEFGLRRAVSATEEALLRLAGRD